MSRTNPQQPHDVTVFGMLLGFILQLILCTLIGWLLSIGVGVVLTFLLKPAVTHIYWLSLAKREIADMRLYTPQWYAIAAQKSVQALHHLLVIKTKLSYWLSLWEKGETQNLWLKPYLKVSYSWFGFLPWMIVLLTQLAIIKIWRILASIPLFMLLGILALLDGLVERDLRKWGFGRESALLYHRARRYIPFSILAAVVIYMALPLAITPLAILIPSGISFVLAVFLTARSFKKYL